MTPFSSLESHPLLEQLNPQQRIAVATDLQHTLILAGAGSGKTRVLVHRIAWLCQELNVPSSAIFAVTFTNKAAHEMLERVQHLIGKSQSNAMWIGTFHGLAHRLLRIFYQQADLPLNFQLIDMDDQKRLVRQLFKAHHIDEKIISLTSCTHFIGQQKDLGIRAEQVVVRDNLTKVQQKIYQDYQNLCERMGYVDFSELLLRTYELLKRSEMVRHYCQQRFSHILVDEFQDTNSIQYQLIRLLGGKHGQLFIVGDDDQAIYGWRGATADNLKTFLSDYPETDLIRLEQNYRSTAPILEAANALIAQNSDRLGKELWTDNKHAEYRIRLYNGFNDIDEARSVVASIMDLHQKGISLEQCAILYRNNAQSRILEDTLLQNQLPYKIYGGIRFYERQEVKLVLAYLRLLYDVENDFAFEQVINTPSRKIGEVTLTKLRLMAKQLNQSLWNTALTMLSQKLFSNQQGASVGRFIELMGSIFQEIHEKPLYQQIELIIERTGLRTMYESEEGIKGQSRLENLEELVVGAEQFYNSLTEEEAQETHDETENARKFVGQEEVTEQSALSILEQFLAYTSLEGQAEREQNGVQLMTLHSAKGLEFDYVFIVGWEESLFPSQRANDDPTQLEEERRLAYVGITRARKYLMLSYCSSRRLYGRTEFLMPSRFLTELPESVFEPNTLHRSLKRNKTSSFSLSSSTPEETIPKEVSADQERRQRQRASYEQNKRQPYPIGAKVLHPRFGVGTIIQHDGIDDHLRLHIAFDNEGLKWIVAHLARLQVLS